MAGARPVSMPVATPLSGSASKSVSIAAPAPATRAEALLRFAEALEAAHDAAMVLDATGDPFTDHKWWGHTHKSLRGIARRARKEAGQ